MVLTHFVLIFNKKVILQVVNPEDEGTEPFKIQAKTDQYAVEIHFLINRFKQINYFYGIFKKRYILLQFGWMKNESKSRWKSSLKLRLIPRYLYFYAEVVRHALHSLMSGKWT